MTSAISIYSVLHELWEWSLDNCTVTEIKARIRVVQIHMQHFVFIFGLELGRNLLQGNSMKRGTKLKNRNMCVFTGNCLPEHKTVLQCVRKTHLTRTSKFTFMICGKFKTTRQKK